MPKQARASASIFIDDEAAASDCEPIQPKKRRQQFRIRTQRILLTYSQIAHDFDRDGLGPHLKTLLPNFNCITVAVEEHPTTGGFHIHCYIDCGTPAPAINSPLFFDHSHTHPNIRPIYKTHHTSYAYVVKDGQVIFEEGERPIAPQKETAEKTWRIITSPGSRDEFLKQAVERKPRDTLLHFPSLQAYADYRYGNSVEEYKSCAIKCYSERYPALTEWVQTYLRNPYEGRPKSLVIYGKTLIGKTLWARSLGRHAYFPGLFMLEGFSPELSQYAIFDDMVEGLKGIPPTFKFWLGGQREFVVGDKYMRKQRIRWGKPAIYIANSDPREECNARDLDWLEGNCVFVEITEVLAEPSRDEDWKSI